MAFTESVDQGEFEAMKTLSGRRAPCCDKHQFRAKMKVAGNPAFSRSINMESKLIEFFVFVNF